MKKIILIIGSIILFGCRSESVNEIKEKEELNRIYKSLGLNVYELKHDSNCYIIATCVEGISIIKK